MKYRAIIFDFNGVLLWDIPWHHEAWQKLSQALGKREFTEEQWKAAEGISTKELLPKLFGQPMSEDEIKADESKKDEIYQSVAVSHGDAMALSPGAEELLNLLAEKKIPRAIATSANSTDMAFYIERLHLMKWFDQDVIVCNDGQFRSKPAPDIYLEAANRIGVSPPRCIAIEDSHAGISSAVSAGVGKVIGLGSTARRGELIGYGATNVLESLLQMNLREFEK